MNVDFEGKRFEVVHVVDHEVLVVSIAGAVQGCAQILNGALVANLAADGSAIVSARAVVDVARSAGYGIGFPIAQMGVEPQGRFRFGSRQIVC